MRHLHWCYIVLPHIPPLASLCIYVSEEEKISETSTLSTTKREEEKEVGEAFALASHYSASSSFLQATASFGVMSHSLLCVDVAPLYLLFILVDHCII